MNNIQIIKKRLKDLKNLSENLKRTDSSQKDQNMNIVQLIMDMTRDVQKKRDNDNGSIYGELGLKKIQSESEGKTNRKAMGQNKSQRQNIQPPTNKNLQNSPKNQLIISTPQPDYQKQLELQTHQNQTLKIQISNLTQQIKSLSSRNSQLIAKLTQQKQKTQSLEYQKNNSTYLQEYKLVQNAEVFITRIKANQDDYAKIQYKPLQLSLNLRYIQVSSPRKISKTNIKITQLPQSNKNSKKFDLSDLTEVSYLNNNIIILKFTVDEKEHYMYIKFMDYQRMRKWDIGIFINLTTVKNLQKERMFFQRYLFQEEREKERLKEIQKEKQQQREKQRQREKKQREKQASIMDQELIKSIEFKRNTKNKEEQIVLDRHVADRLNEIIKISRLDQQQGQFLTEYYKQNQKLIRMYQKLKDMHILQRIQIKIEEPRQNIGKNLSIRSESVSRRLKTLDESIQNQFNVIKGQQINKKIQSKILKQDSTLNKQQIDKMNKQKQKQQFKTIKKQLKVPIYVTKYAQGAMKPHLKKLYLSQDQNKLCWQDNEQTDKNSFKFIFIENIVSVQLGKIGVGVEKLVGKAEIGNLKKYLLINLKNEKKKTLEISCSSADILQNFSNNLKKFLEERQNYDIETNEKKVIKF